MPNRIIVADDDPGITLLCREILTDEGYIVECDYAQGALALILSHPPDLVLLDLAMPGMDGTEIVVQMRAHKPTAQVPIVIMTAFRHPEQWFDDLHVTGYLIKPWSVETLIGVVKNICLP